METRSITLSPKSHSRSLSWDPSENDAEERNVGVRRKAQSWEGPLKKVRIDPTHDTCWFEKVDPDSIDDIWFTRIDMRTFIQTELKRRRALGIASRSALLEEPNDVSMFPDEDSGLDFVSKLPNHVSKSSPSPPIRHSDLNDVLAGTMIRVKPIVGPIVGQLCSSRHCVPARH
eukprot:CAMPEP_0185765892 /NCGR_PEP_ID=MMETSP1174-20130828/33146_1 /TAXON_ID=35687 /ORGANISM="Dictyocha speculum, Strain CCMP1381" /LENGTH=172 /DNA_ID=CAMNT_0028449317 /DNA_START=91 /DNA_END=609 /DNA_ORIENTATION=-